MRTLTTRNVADACAQYRRAWRGSKLKNRRRVVRRVRAVTTREPGLQPTRLWRLFGTLCVSLVVPRVPPAFLFLFLFLFPCMCPSCLSMSSFFPSLIAFLSCIAHLGRISAPLTSQTSLCHMRTSAAASHATSALVSRQLRWDNRHEGTLPISRFTLALPSVDAPRSMPSLIPAGRTDAAWVRCTCCSDAAESPSRGVVPGQTPRLVRLQHIAIILKPR